jgi:hypothetical protein
MGRLRCSTAWGWNIAPNNGAASWAKATAGQSNTEQAIANPLTSLMRPPPEVIRVRPIGPEESGAASLNGAHHW